jgi:hypothetical protein
MPPKLGTRPSPDLPPAAGGVEPPAVEQLLGEWTLTMSNAWFLSGTETQGPAVFEWLGDVFIVMRSELAGEPAWDFVIGHNDPHDRYVVLYHDERGVSSGVRHDAGTEPRHRRCR